LGPTQGYIARAPGWLSSTDAGYSPDSNDGVCKAEESLLLEAVAMEWPFGDRADWEKT
jgi:hypothetical protein